MKSEELELFLKEFKKELYQFSFVLLPDDLQASQIVVDTIALFLADQLDFGTIDLDSVKLSLLDNAYQIANKRYQHIIFETQLGKENFFKMSCENRASLFLFFKLSLSTKHIAHILRKNEAEITTLLTRAKKCLFDNNGLHFEQE